MREPRSGVWGGPGAGSEGAGAAGRGVLERGLRGPGTGCGGGGDGAMRACGVAELRTLWGGYLVGRPKFCGSAELQAAQMGRWGGVRGRLGGCCGLGRELRADGVRADV